MHASGVTVRTNHFAERDSVLAEAPTSSWRPAACRIPTGEGTTMLSSWDAVRHGMLEGDVLTTTRRAQCALAAADHLSRDKSTPLNPRDAIEWRPCGLRSARSWRLCRGVSMQMDLELSAPQRENRIMVTFRNSTGHVEFVSTMWSWKRGRCRMTGCSTNLTRRRRNIIDLDAMRDGRRPAGWDGYL